MLESKFLLNFNWRFTNLTFGYVFQVEKLARESFFFLRESFPYDEASFGSLSDQCNSRKPMAISKPISYVFYLRPPSSIEFDDFKAVLNGLLVHTC